MLHKTKISFLQDEAVKTAATGEAEFFSNLSPVQKGKGAIKC